MITATPTTQTARQLLDLQISEKAFQQQIVDLARACGFLTYHTRNSTGSEPGFPDLVLVGARMIFLEVKREKGKVSVAQAEWIHRLRSAGCLAMVVRPSDWRQIEQMLVAEREVVE